MSVTRLLLAALAAAFLATAPAHAMEDKMFPSKTHPWRKYTGNLPPCGFPKVFDRIAWHFYERETQYWESRMQIAGFQHPQEIALSPWGLEYIPRRYCKADVFTSDGVKREMFYSIGEDLGEASIGWGVEWCITGMDRNLAYAPRCKMARP
jgi:hypothetical protein